MKTLFLVLIIVLGSTQYVDSSFITFISQAFDEIKTDITSFFSELSRRLIIKLHDNDILTAPRVKVNKPIRISRERGSRGAVRTAAPHQAPRAPPAVLLASPAALLAATHGRALEVHVVYTSDGYVLTLHRLSMKLRLHNQGTVLLHHGLLGSSGDWLLLGATKSLPYLLSDAGYDVWLANARGNYYSRAHLFRSTNSKGFWDFSWQEIGERDLPAIVHYMRETTNCSQGINYVGHGMGATALLVLLSVKPEYNKYLKVAVLLAPLAMMGHVRGPLAEQAVVLDELPAGEYPSGNPVMLPLTEKHCTAGPELCTNSLFSLTGALLQKDYADESFLSFLRHNVPAGGSSKTVKHYAQLVKHKKFHKFGKEHEEFKLQYIYTPIAIFSSNNDLISDIIDNQNLYNAVSTPVGHIIIENKNVSHTEFVWGLNADKEIFPKVIDLIVHGPDVNKWSPDIITAGLPRQKKQLIFTNAVKVKIKWGCSRCTS